MSQACSIGAIYHTRDMAHESPPWLMLQFCAVCGVVCIVLCRELHFLCNRAVLTRATVTFGQKSILLVRD